MTGATRQTGFTLIELLVVMFIVGVIAAMATLSIGVATSEKGTEKEVERLADLLALASEEAVLQGREFGLTFYARGYEFSTFEPATGRWQPLADTESDLRPRQLPPETVLELSIDERAIKLPEELQYTKPARAVSRNSDATDANEKGADDEKSKQVSPQVFILSSGDMTPFRLRMQAAPGVPGLTLDVSESGATTEVRDEP